jgi:hypothetical protein
MMSMYVCMALRMVALGSDWKCVFGSSHKLVLTYSTEHNPVSVSVNNHITLASKDRSTGRESSAHPVGVLAGGDGGLGSQAQGEST